MARTRVSPKTSCRLIGLTWVAIIIGCASNPAEKSSSIEAQRQARHDEKGPSSRASEQSQELREYREIELFYSKNLNSAALRRMNLFAKKHPQSVLLPSVENLEGLLYLRTKSAIQAVPHFQKAIALSSANPIFAQYILYNLATAELESNQIENAQISANQINLDSLDKPNRIKVYHLRANIYSKLGLPLESVRQILMGANLLTELDSNDTKNVFRQQLQLELDKIKDEGTLQQLIHEFKNSPLADSLQAHSQNTGPIQSRTIGILLPMKGKFGKFGIKSLQGIQLAFGIFNTTDPDTKVKLVVEDSGETTEQAVQALSNLALKHQVAAVIGPMVSKGIDQISQKAEELAIPLISLARRASPLQNYVFQAGLTQQIQAQQLAQYAFEKLGARKFAIIYPSEKLGIDASHSFWDAIDSLGGQVVGFESYTPGETDFRQLVDKLSGLFYTEARQRELELLAQEREANHIKKRTRKTEQFFHLSPIVDYDAVFIPDDPKIAGQILPTFAYRDVEHVKFLGTSEWNTPDFINRAQTYGENACFVDAFFAESSSAAVKKFAEKYKATYGQEASSLEALAYDAGLLLKHVLSSPEKELSRLEIRDRLKTIHDFHGITGKLTYRDGQFYRDLTVIKVKNGQFVEASRK